jgi:hypothetical protein
MILGTRALGRMEIIFKSGAGTVAKDETGTKRSNGGKTNSQEIRTGTARIDKGSGFRAKVEVGAEAKKGTE